jgi:hypothetical protein
MQPAMAPSATGNGAPARITEVIWSPNYLPGRAAKESPAFCEAFLVTGRVGLLAETGARAGRRKRRSAGRRTAADRASGWIPGGGGTRSGRARRTRTRCAPRGPHAGSTHRRASACAARCAACSGTCSSRTAAGLCKRERAGKREGCRQCDCRNFHGRFLSAMSMNKSRRGFMFPLQRWRHPPIPSLKGAYAATMVLHRVFPGFDATPDLAPGPSA